MRPQPRFLLHCIWNIAAGSWQIFPVVLFWLQIQPTWIRFVSSRPQETMLLLCQGFKNCLAPESASSVTWATYFGICLKFLCPLCAALVLQAGMHLVAMLSHLDSATLLHWPMPLFSLAAASQMATRKKVILNTVTIPTPIQRTCVALRNRAGTGACLCVPGSALQRRFYLKDCCSWACTVHEMQ